MKRLFLFVSCLIVSSFLVFAQQKKSLSEFVTGDPYIFADTISKTYYLIGTDISMWKSKDLKSWEGPISYLQWDKESWIGTQPAIWAPEIHEYDGSYYCFLTFTNRGILHGKINNRDLPLRSTTIFRSDNITGPYREIKEEPYLPENKCTLDGTLFVDSSGRPYMIYCYEWIQNVKGTMEVVALKKDVSDIDGASNVLFMAYDSPFNGSNIVTDGPFVFRTKSGRLGMLWSNYDTAGSYIQTVAYSTSGSILGPWVQDKDPLTPPRYGHGSLFRTFDGRLLLVCHGWHQVNGKSERYPVLFEVDDSDKLKLIGPYNP